MTDGRTTFAVMPSVLTSSERASVQRMSAPFAMAYAAPFLRPLSEEAAPTVTMRPYARARIGRRHAAVACGSGDDRGARRKVLHPPVVWTVGMGERGAIGLELERRAIHSRRASPIRE